MGRAALLALALVAQNDRQSKPVSWDDVVERYERVRDYTALYEKEERAISNGERQRIRLSFRKPLDVRLDWLNDKGAIDQTAVYRQGFNDGKLLARRSGVLGGLAGIVRLDPGDRLALQDSRHPITEVGLGYLIDRVTEAARRGRVTAKAPVEDMLDARLTDRFDFDAVSPADVFGIDGARHAKLWIDRELELPVQVEVRDANNTLLERHRFHDLHFDVGLSDRTFSL